MTTFSYKNTPDSDVDRLVRQRKVYTSLFQRLIAADSAAREKDIFGRLMGGANAIRMKNDTESMRAMLLDPSDGKLEEMTTAQALAGMFGELAKVPLENIQFYVMPAKPPRRETTPIIPSTRPIWPRCSRSILILMARRSPKRTYRWRS